MDGVVLVVVVGAIAVVAAIVLGGYFQRGARLRRALRGAPRSAIAEVAEGAVVRVHGTVTAGATIIAPLTGRSCVFYEAVVEERVSNGKSSSWRQRVREVRGVPFVIDDGTGRTLVDPTNAEVDVHLDATLRSGFLDDPTPTEQAFLQRHAQAGQGWVFNKQLRYREGVIEVGERIAAMGRPVREPDPDAVGQVGGYRDALPTRVRLGGSPAHPIVLSDDASVAHSDA